MIYETAALCYYICIVQEKIGDFNRNYLIKRGDFLMSDICDDYGFQFVDNVENPPVKLVSVGKEARYTSEYYWDNRDRWPCYLFQYTLNGSGTLKEKEKTWRLEKEEGFFLKTPGDTIYCFDEKENEAPWELLYLMLEGKGVEPYYAYIVKRFGKVFTLSEQHPAIKKLVEIHAKARGGLLKNAFLADQEAFAFLCLLCSDGNQDEQNSSFLVKNAKEYIEENYEKPLSLLSAAESLGVSQSHLSREFVRYTGEQPIKYLTKIRLEKAADLLCSTEMTLDQISAACGFGDGNYFSKVFKKYMKISPGEFRKRVKIQSYKNVKI